MKQFGVISSAVVSILFAGLTSQAYANQLDALLLPAQNSFQVHFTAFRSIELRYPEAGSLAKMLAGEPERLEFSEQGEDTQAVTDILNGAVRVRGPIHWCLTTPLWTM